MFQTNERRDSEHFGFGWIGQLRRQARKHMQHSPSRNVIRDVSEYRCWPTGKRRSTSWKQQVAGFRSLPAAAGQAPVYWEGFR